METTENINNLILISQESRNLLNASVQSDLYSTQLINSKPYYQITDAPIKLFLYIDLLLSLGTEHIAPNES